MSILDLSLEIEIKSGQKEIVSDGYEMSVGEIINLYKDEEIIINPDFQRLFRWDICRKTRFIESLLLGIPIPPIFVYQDEDGIWELIDGLQRLSTILEFVGILRAPDGELVTPSTLEGTKFLPSLAEKKWIPSSEKSEDGIGQAAQLQIKRSRIRVEILKHESDKEAKYELFQRLNTGGAELSEQEVRNCIAVMVNKPFHEWLINSAGNIHFLEVIDLTEKALEKQTATELALRFFVFRNVLYKKGLDVHEFLDEAMLEIATDTSFNMISEFDIFNRTFSLLKDILGANSFKRWDGSAFKGQFLMSVFEVVATGISKNLTDIEALPNKSDFIESKCKSLWEDDTFKQNSGAGVRGTSRLANLLPMAEEFFKVQ